MRIIMTKMIKKIFLKRELKKKKTFNDKKSNIKINEYFTKLNNRNKRRKTVMFLNSSEYIYNNLNSLNNSKKDIKKVNKQLNLPNINSKNQLNSSKNIVGNKKEYKEIIKKN